MKQLKRLALSIIAAACLPLASAGAADWDDPQEPFTVFGNSHYVGVRGLSSILITSPSGHILLDGGSPKSPVQIAAHIRQLGYKLEDIKYILSTHEHFDHAGGIAELQRLTGATVLGSVKSVPVLRTGVASSGDPQFGDLSPFSPVANARAVNDGETVTLGPLAVTAHYTPGHTQGGVSWTWRSTEGGKTASMVYADSLNAMSAGTFRYSGDKAYPNARADVEQSIARLAAFDCDILVSAHPEASDLWTRKEKQPAIGNSAFIDPDACRHYAAKGRARLERTLAEEAAKR